MRADPVLTRLAPRLLLSRRPLYELTSIHDDDVGNRGVGARHCSMYARKMGPFIAPSIRKGATIPSVCRQATNVIVFQCPCGTDAISRSPRGQRPLSRTMFVLVAVSSINTSRAGSSMPCSRTQRRRARATSARFCSAACRLFFKADIVSIKETLESAPTAGDALFSHDGENLLEGQIRLFGNQSQDPVRVLFQWRNTPAAHFSAPRSLSHSSVGTIELPN